MSQVSYADLAHYSLEYKGSVKTLVTSINPFKASSPFSVFSLSKFIACKSTLIQWTEGPITDNFSLPEFIINFFAFFKFVSPCIPYLFWNPIFQQS